MSRLMVTWQGCTVLRFSTASEHDSKMGIRVERMPEIACYITLNLHARATWAERAGARSERPSGWY
jgi:hypothetical protein